MSGIYSACPEKIIKKLSHGHEINNMWPCNNFVQPYLLDFYFLPKLKYVIHFYVKKNNSNLSLLTINSLCLEMTLIIILWPQDTLFLMLCHLTSSIEIKVNNVIISFILMSKCFWCTTNENIIHQILFISSCNAGETVLTVLYREVPLHDVNPAGL